jgi:catechol 2,3-dioxygenase-like lactoylglutathione lyase family enzyme
MPITEIAFTCYPVTDMARSRAFYEGILGLKPGNVTDLPDGPQWVEYEIGSGAFALGRADGWTPSTEGGNVAFEVEDFDATIAELRAAGVQFRVEPFPTPVCRMAMIIDPDGTTVCIHKRSH